ncbi:YIP1 family protein [Metallibacterium scheffleri]
MSSSNASPFATLGNIFVDPGTAYDDIRGHNRWLWWPLILMVVASIAMSVIFFSHADVKTMVAQQMAAQHPTPAQMQAAAKFQSPMVLMAIDVVGILIGIPVVYLIIALYYFLIAKLAGWNEQGFGSWFSFAVWSGFPGILAPIISTVVLLLRGHAATSVQDVDVLSFNALLFHLPATDKWYSMVSGLSPISIWVIALSIFGLARWTKRGAGHAALVVIAPLVIFYGVWAAFKVWL